MDAGEDPIPFYFSVQGGDAGLVLGSAQPLGIYQGAQTYQHPLPQG